MTIAESERKGSHSISEATTSLMRPTSASRSHSVIIFDATTAAYLLQLDRLGHRSPSFGSFGEGRARAILLKATWRHIGVSSLELLFAKRASLGFRARSPGAQEWAPLDELMRRCVLATTKAEDLSCRICGNAFEYVEMPTWREEPWERDRRALEDRERRRWRLTGDLGGGSDHLPASRVELSDGGRSKARRDPGLFLRSPRQRLVAWFFFLVLVLAGRARGLW
jgi:hypothetical protein